MVTIRGLAVLGLAGLGGCVVAPVVPAPVPYVAVPGPAKTEAQFYQDDAACRVAAVPLPPGPGVTPPPTAAMAQPVAPPEPPGVSYLRCMAAHANAIQPLPQARPAVYAYASAYPVYVGAYGDYYPWLYGGGFYGFYGGFGYRGGYGYREGFYHGGYGGYGGYHGGGFHR